jgi:two-component system, OmpR family, alkaline phosphatase synthesis response regulator PhoP
MNDNKLKILLVDDEIDILEFISYNLEKEGYVVYTGKMAWKQLSWLKSTSPT